jgi:DNA-binding transcriptional LysR family regulator
MRWVTPSELSPIRIILQPAGNLRRERILTSLKAAQVEIVETLDLDSTLGTLEFVANSDFAAILPAMTMEPEIHDKALCVRPIRSHSLQLDLIAIEPSRRDPSPIAGLLAAAFAESIGQVNQTVAALGRR